MTYQLATAKIWDGSQWVAAAGGGATFDYPEQAQTSGATINVAASSTINTKGAWVELIASTTATTDWLSMLIVTQASGTDTSSLLDIGIGASGSEQVLIENMAAGFMTINATFYSPIMLPVRIASGTRIAARSQSTTASRNVPVSITTYTSAVASPTSVDTIGAVTASSRGTNLPNNNTYVQLTASTSQAFRAVLMVPTGGGSLSIASESSTYTLGSGPSGSETDLMARACGSTSSEQIGVATTSSLPLYIGNIPAGTRLAVKQSVGRTYRDVILYGIPA